MPGFEYILSDEAQGLTPCQAEVLFRQNEIWAGSAAVYVVGDENQLLYGWRGVWPETFQDMALFALQPLEMTLYTASGWHHEKGWL